MAIDNPPQYGTWNGVFFRRSGRDPRHWQGQEQGQGQGRGLGRKGRGNGQGAQGQRAQGQRAQGPGAGAGHGRLVQRQSETGRRSARSCRGYLVGLLHKRKASQPHVALNHMERYEALDALAGNQYGLITLTQMLELGFQRRGIRDMLTGGRLILMRPGVYRLCGSRLSWRCRALGAVLAAGGDAVLSHLSAGILWGLVARDASTGTFEITRSRFCRPSGVIVHRHRLQREEGTVHLGIPVTTPARTVLDLAESIEEPILGQLCDDALRRRLLTLRDLTQMYELHAGSGRRYLRTIRSALSDRGAGYGPGANRWEQEMDRMWDRMGLPPAVKQYAIRTEGGLYIPDRAIVEHKVAVDWNGFEYHGLRSRFDRDSKRRSHLAASGWYPLDFTARSEPALVCQTVLAVVEERRRLFGISV